MEGKCKEMEGKLEEAKEKGRQRRKGGEKAKERKEAGWRAGRGEGRKGGEPTWTHCVVLDPRAFSAGPLLREVAGGKEGRGQGAEGRGEGAGGRVLREGVREQVGKGGC